MTAALTEQTTIEPDQGLIGWEGGGKEPGDWKEPTTVATEEGTTPSLARPGTKQPAVEVSRFKDGSCCKVKALREAGRQAGRRRNAIDDFQGIRVFLAIS